MKHVLLVSVVVALTLSNIQGMVPQALAQKASLLLNGPASQDDKVKIKKEELPEAAIKTLDGDVYKSWTIVNVFKLKNGEYEVELKKGDISQSLKFDKEGKIKSTL